MFQSDTPGPLRLSNLNEFGFCALLIFYFLVLVQNCSVAHSMDQCLNVKYLIAADLEPVRTTRTSWSDFSSGLPRDPLQRWDSFEMGLPLEKFRL